MFANMEKKLKLEHLAPYLAYGLKCHSMGYTDDDGKGIVSEIIGIELEGVYTRNKISDDYHAISDTFPILRPLSDLFKWVDYNDGHGLVQLGYKYGIVTDDNEYCEVYNADQCESPQAFVPLSNYNFWLFENHFDIFGLIDQGLAIDVNTLNK